MLHAGAISDTHILPFAMTSASVSQTKVSTIDISGRVVDSLGHGVRSVPVHIGEGANLVVTTTNVQGQFTLHGVSPAAASQLLIVDGPNAFNRGRYTMAVATAKE
jgi:hypothetical protein